MPIMAFYGLYPELNPAIRKTPAGLQKSFYYWEYG